MMDGNVDYVKQWLELKSDAPQTEDTPKPSSLAELYFSAAKLRAYGEFLTGFSNSIIMDIDSDVRRDLAFMPTMPTEAIPPASMPAPTPLEGAISNKDRLGEVIKLANEASVKIVDILGRVRHD